MTTPSPVNFRGFQACLCLVEWIPFVERELRARGLLPKGETIRIYQLNGNAPESAGTHQGGAFDWTDLPGEEDLWVIRQMGADAAWLRPFNWNGRNGIAHIHGVLRGCPHNQQARYQIAAVDAGYNGLGSGGRGGPDTGPRPLSGRTWREGIAWHHEQAKIRKRRRLTARILDLVTQRKRLTARVNRLRDKRSSV